MAKIKAETLLRKIQKGSNKLGKSRYNFNIEDGKIQVFKRREIIKPYMYSQDSTIVNSSIREAINQANSGKMHPTEIEKEMKRILPTHLINDLYSLYYNNSTKLQFESLDNTNNVKFKILDSINNSLIKIITNDSHISSYVFTEEIGKYLYAKFSKMSEEDKEKLAKALENCNQGDGEGNGQSKSSGNGDEEGDEDGKGQGSGNGEGEDSDGEGQKEMGYDRQDSKGNEKNQKLRDSKTGKANNSFGNNSKKDFSQEALDKMIEQLLNSKQSKSELETAFKQAEEKLDKLKEIGVDIENTNELPEEEKNEIIRNLNNIDNLKTQLSYLKVSKEKVLKAVQKILNNTSNYFTARCITKDVELFEAEELLDINGLELLHPIFQNSRLLDLNITERRYIGKFDLYVDCSGSMSSGCGGDLSSVRRIDLAKALAMQMKQMGILGDLYEFEDKPRKIQNTDISILMMDARGGTNIETVLQNVARNGNNSVILTDGESSVSSYTHKALFIGVGCNFSYFKRDGGCGQKLVENDQCIVYNGKDFVMA